MEGDNFQIVFPVISKEVATPTVEQWVADNTGHKDGISEGRRLQTVTEDKWAWILVYGV